MGGPPKAYVRITETAGFLGLAPLLGCVNYVPGIFTEEGLDLTHIVPVYMGGCQNHGPFLDPYYNTAPNIWGTQKGTIILTTTHMGGEVSCIDYQGLGAGCY